MISCSHEYDLVVVGGGTAGWVSALAAARYGKEVILIEKKGYIGGVLTSGLPILGFHDINHKQVVKGIANELVERTVKAGGSNGYHISELWHSSLVNLESSIVKSILFEMLKENNVSILLFSQVTDAIKEDGELKGVVVQGKSEKRIIFGKNFVDASGDATLCKVGGLHVQTEKKQQPPTLVFRIENVKIAELREFLVKNPNHFVDWRMRPGCKVREEFIRSTEMFLIFPELIKDISTVGDYLPLIDRIMFTVTPTGNGVVVNMLRAHNIDGTSSESLSEATINLYRNLLPLGNFLKEKIPGFSDSYICDSEPEIQLRETSRIMGKYQLTADDIINQVSPSDSIAVGGYFIDVHDSSSSSGQWKPTQGGYGIPYRALLPKEGKNIIAAGRIISGTQEAAGSYRVMATCMAMGQAAGTASALALDQGVDVSDIDIGKLRKLLVSDEAIVDV